MLAAPAHAAWLIPTPGFRRDVFAARDPSQAFWLRTTDPQRALANLLVRDELFTDAIAAGAVRDGLTTIAVDGRQPVDPTVAAVADQFDL